MNIFHFCCNGSTPRVSLITLSGSISSNTGVSFKNAKKKIDSAFSQPNLKAICLKINSPGGSPVQSHLIAEYIRNQSEKHQVPVFCFVEDKTASGGYLVACSADLIFASRFSMVGSIGVVMTSFSYVGLMDMLGIESKVYTAGPRKAGVNPLTRTTEEEEMDLRNLLSETHMEFINYVKERRLEKIKEEDNDDLFSGAVFGSARALELGLVDGIYTVMEDKVAELIGETKFKMVEFKIKGGGIKSLDGLASLSKYFGGNVEKVELDIYKMIVIVWESNKASM
jgi:signal peptide peptidase SppA